MHGESVCILTGPFITAKAYRNNFRRVATSHEVRHNRNLTQVPEAARSVG